VPGHRKGFLIVTSDRLRRDYVWFFWFKKPDIILKLWGLCGVERLKEAGEIQIIDIRRK
jgi:hypothetical protein